MKNCHIRIGTSGFSYPEWKGTFYPPDLPAKKFLSYYAQNFPTTEINNTFYRLPTPKLTADWYKEVPDDFSFTLKMNQKITHSKRLKNVREEMLIFLEAASELKQKLGTILVQLPPYFHRDDAVLEDFLSQYSPEANLAFEFRHISWFDSAIYSMLRKHQAAWAVVEVDEQEAVREVTGKFIYMRLRKLEYSPGELADWAEWMQNQTVDIYCYFKHEASAPLLAKGLMEALNLRG